jgi:hypothetical protein
MGVCGCNEDVTAMVCRAECHDEEGVTDTVLSLKPDHSFI